MHNTSVSATIKFAPSRDLARVIVGPERKEFHVNKKLLSAAVAALRDRLDASSPAAMIRLGPGYNKPLPMSLPHQTSALPIYLPDESPAMFELFTVWLHQKDGFRHHLDDMINLVSDAPETVSDRFHWSLVDLHIFAARHDLDQLQDLSVDALQDLYLRCNWDVTPQFITFLFGERGARDTMRLRRWATAMVAWLLAASPSEPRDNIEPSSFHALFQLYPDFHVEYTLHVAKLKKGKLDARIKNPQLRIPANRLRNDERQFGFRQCSFHTHRAAVGEGKCPHDIKSVDMDNYPILVPLMIDVRPAKFARTFKHVKSPSCPAAPLLRYDNTMDMMPAPLRYPKPKTVATLNI
ncbi:hypothetical protein SODALDRAFT_339177 [Sodiomyces alkalinus F11]|uniref:BTB domain-containing protein n=1 Tax=Sodiomyces alkalinus (strain CBS 110278 / VKM F-3762 / F11) TaxID=1314773 RepID=A0A3N2PYZ2_SODAK|nr:hypothetical protein SODALDRAFT_339177 [Sodiomyces alkalinus F11]ROT39749.1 hypothetical protein SODALDRAFT_339177 [Sodiomyces alkalinus F11]